MDTWEHGPVEGFETTTTRRAGWHTPGRVSGPGRTARREGLGLKAAARPGAKAHKTLRAGQWPGVARPRVRWRSAVGHAWCAAVLAGAAASTHGQQPVPPEQARGGTRWRRERARRCLGAGAWGTPERPRCPQARPTWAQRARPPPARRRLTAGARRAGPRLGARGPGAPG